MAATRTAVLALAALLPACVKAPEPAAPVARPSVVTSKVSVPLVLSPAEAQAPLPPPARAPPAPPPSVRTAPPPDPRYVRTYPGNPPSRFQSSNARGG